MALVSSVKRLLHVHPAITFFAGMLAGLLISQLSADSMRPFPITAPPQLLSSLPRQGVSHAPDVKKRVLAAKGDIPHVTQIAVSELLSGQVASENWHKDMVEVFVFTEGEGILHLDDRNHSVRSGSFAIVYPRTRHTIYNLPEAAKPLTLLSMAVVR